MRWLFPLLLAGSSLSMMTARSWAPPSTGVQGDISVDRFGARGDGRTDDTRAIQSAVDALQPGAAVRFPPGTYRINAETGIRLKDDTRLELGSATLTGANVNRARCRLLEIQGGKRVTISGGTLLGSRAGEPEWGVGILASDAEDLVIQGVTLRDFYFDGILLTGNSGCRRVVVRECLSENNRRTGLAIPSAADVTVEASTFQGSRGQSPEAGVNCEPGPGATVRGVRFNGCSFLGNAGVGLYIHKALGVAVYDAWVRDSRVEGNDLGIVASGVEGVTIVSNHLKGSLARGKSAIALGDGTRGAAVSENHVEGFRGIVSAGATQVQIRANTLVGTGPAEMGGGIDGDGIVCRGLRSLLADACVVSDNDVRHWAGSGIVAQLVTGVKIQDNRISDTGRSGVYLASVTRSEISGNEISGSGMEARERYDGLELVNSTDDNLVANNTVRLGSGTRGGVRVGAGCRGNNVFGTVVIPWDGDR